ncbi:MAG TPA: phosphatase PAP2 family protein [Acidimicrobiia bacterium]|jgi:hypothetical protein
MWLEWQPALVLALALAAFAWAVTRSPRRLWNTAGAFSGEAALVFVLYAVWRLAGRIAITQTTRAHEMGRRIWELEQRLHLPSEVSFQRLFLPHPDVMRVLNAYYAVVHVPALIAFLVWLFARYRDRYPPVRNVIAISTGLCLAIQLVPVAPPRMFPELGFVDAAHVYGLSVYDRLGSNGADQLSAMPSVHVAWAVAIGIAVVLVSSSRWRWLFLAHPVLTVVVVTATANHWWLDGVVGVATLVLAAALDRSARWALRSARTHPRRRRREAGIGPLSLDDRAPITVSGPAGADVTQPADAT